jgi:hypothetical protein
VPFILYRIAPQSRGVLREAQTQGDDCVQHDGAQELVAGAVVLEEPRLQPQVAKQEVGRGTVRLTLAMPRALHMRLKLVAVRQERSIVSLVSGWIEERTVAA